MADTQVTSRCYLICPAVRLAFTRLWSPDNNCKIDWQTADNAELGGERPGLRAFPFSCCFRMLVTPMPLILALQSLPYGLFTDSSANIIDHPLSGTCSPTLALPSHAALFLSSRPTTIQFLTMAVPSPNHSFSSLEQVLGAMT